MKAVLFDKLFTILDLGTPPLRSSRYVAYIMKSKFFKYSLFAFVTALFLVVSYVCYLASTYIDDEVLSGEGYGFTIGDSKIASFQNIGKSFPDGPIYILHPLNSNSFGPHKELTFSQNDYALLSERETWNLYFNDGFYDFVRLSFSDEQLVKIYRHRKNFELP